MVQQNTHAQTREAYIAFTPLKVSEDIELS